MVSKSIHHLVDLLYSANYLNFLTYEIDLDLVKFRSL